MLMTAAWFRRHQTFAWFFENPVWAEVILGLCAAAWAIHLLFFDTTMFTSSPAWAPLLLMAPQWMWGFGALVCWSLTCLSLRLNSVLVKVSSHVMSLMVFAGMSSVLFQFDSSSPGWMVHAILAIAAALIMIRGVVPGVVSTRGA